MFSCDNCGSQRFRGVQEMELSVAVCYDDERGFFFAETPKQSDAKMIGDPKGPFECCECGKRFDSLS